MFGILDKVREVDAALRRLRSGNIFEGHPEVSFALMNNGSPLLIGKKKSAGRDYRTELISRCFSGASEKLSEHRHHREDILDAYALLWTAKRIKSNNARTFPSDHKPDRLGLRMEIVG
jgi:predicted RNase H-like nuclease